MTPPFPGSAKNRPARSRSEGSSAESLSRKPSTLRRRRRVRRRCRGLKRPRPSEERDRKSTRLNSSHLVISYAVFCLKKKKISCFVPAGGTGYASSKNRAHISKTTRQVF